MDNKEFLIKLLTEEESSGYPIIIKSIKTNRPIEYLKLYKKIKENEIPIYINNSCYKKFNGKEAFITDIRILFGDEDTFTTLEIYVEVL